MTDLSLTPRESAQARDIALANRILAGKAILARNMAPGQVEASDIHLFDDAGRCVSKPGLRVYLEPFLHARIYAARPDVGAIVHNHSVSVIPFGIVASTNAGAGT